MNSQTNTETRVACPMVRSGDRRSSPWWQAWRVIQRNPITALSGLIVLGIVVVALSAPWITPYDPYQSRVGPRLHAPLLTYPLGTDSLGRDMLSRIVIGSQVVLLVSISSIGLGVSVGTLIGLVSGWTEGVVDQIFSASHRCHDGHPGSGAGHGAGLRARHRDR